MKKIRLFSMFSGYGTDSFALKRIPYLDVELVGFSEIDKYAIQCFQQNHGGKNYGDCRKINPLELPDFDLLTAGFPCQAFSVAGKMKGELDTRGTLFYEIIRIAEVKKPKWMLLENVEGLTMDSFKDTFKKIISEIKRIGYGCYVQILNTKDYGIPQSRSRVWFVCIRDDIDEPFKFQFPSPEPLKIFIKDILEPVVDKKYYLSPKLQKRFEDYLKEKNRLIGKNQPAILDLYNKKVKDDGTCITLTDPCNNNIRLIEGDKGMVYEHHNSHEIREFGEISNCLKNSMGTGGNNVPMVAISNFSKREMGFKEDVCPTLLSRDYKDPKIVSNTITTAVGKIGHSSEELGYIENNMKCGQLRRLTPKETFRLQGFLNDEVILDNMSDTQKYKLAGNGQSVNVVEKIFRKMFEEFKE